MRTRSWLGSLLAISLISATLLGGTPAQASSAPHGQTCPALAPGSISSQSFGGWCLDHGQYFDLNPAPTSDESANAVAISGDGKRVVLARAVADPFCAADPGSDPAGQELEIIPGTLSALNVSWLEPVYLSAGCERLDSAMNITLNKDGTFAAVMFSSAGVERRHIYTEALRWASPGSLTPISGGLLLWTSVDNVARALKTSIARNTNDMLFSVGIQSAGSQPDQSLVARLNPYTLEQSSMTTTGDLILDSGISANGQTIFALAKSAQDNDYTSAKLSAFVCRGQNADCNYDRFFVAHQSPELVARAAMNDAGTELAISWTRPIGSVTRHFATAFPIPNLGGQDLEVPVNIRPITNDRTQTVDALPVFISPKGDRLWVGGLDSAADTTFALSATVNKYLLNWANPNKADMFIPESDSKAALAVSRSGRVVTALTNANLQTSVVSVADGNLGPAKWQPTFLGGNSGWYPTDYRIAVSDDGSRYIASFKTSIAPSRAIAVTGVLLPFQFAKKLPKVAGRLRLGTKLKVSGDTWKVAGGSNTYQWLRDGAWITNATTSKYTLTTADLGHLVTVAVRHRKSGYYDRLLIAGSNAVVTGGRIGATDPSIGGTYAGHPYLNTTLTVDVSLWSPAGLTFSYAWKVGGVTVGTSPTYTPQLADAGKTITVKVTATKLGYTTVSKTSLATGTVFGSNYGVCSLGIHVACE